MLKFCFVKVNLKTEILFVYLFFNAITFLYVKTKVNERISISKLEITINQPARFYVATVGHGYFC